MNVHEYLINIFINYFCSPTYITGVSHPCVVALNRWILSFYSPKILLFLHVLTLG